MKHLGVILALVILAIVVTVSTAAGPDPQIVQLKNRVRLANLKISDLQDQVDAQDAVISDQNDTIARLRYRLNNQPDPVDVITSRNPDAMWGAMIAIWRAFPTLDAGQLCGYDKTNTPGTGDALTLTSWTFYSWRGC